MFVILLALGIINDTADQDAVVQLVFTKGLCLYMIISQRNIGFY